MKKSGLNNSKGISSKVLLSGLDTNGAQVIFQDIVSPGIGPPLHIHHKQDETFFFLEGIFEIELEGKRLKMKPGDVAFIPMGAVHTWKNIGNSMGRFRYIFTPALNIEKMFAEIDKAKVDGKLSDDVLIQVMSKYEDQEIVGPPI